MKTLQNNFTTPEQSKRLLELGVPADSADCIYVRYARDEKFKRKFIEDIISDDWQNNTDFYVPCWSIGRLIEILKICVIDKDALAEIFEELRDCVDEIKSLIKIFDEYSDVLDFSKLEE